MFHFVQTKFEKMKEWARPDSNRRLTPCKGAVIAARPRAHMFTTLAITQKMRTTL